MRTLIKSDNCKKYNVFGQEKTGTLDEAEA